MPALLSNLFLELENLGDAAFVLDVLPDLGLEDIALILKPPSLAPGQSVLLDLHLQTQELLLHVLILNVAEIDVVFLNENMVPFLDRYEIRINLRLYFRDRFFSFRKAWWGMCVSRR